MDFKTEAISGGDVPTELLEPPPMDLEETSGPQHPTEDLPSSQQPSPASGGVEVTLTPPPNMESSNPGMAELQTSLGEVQSPEWLLDSQDSSPQVYTEVGLEGSRNAMEEGVTEPPREQRSWMNPGIDAEVGNSPQAPSSIDQSDPLMELEEREENIVAEDVPDVDQIQLQGLVTQLERLSPSFHDSSPTSEDGLLPASDGEESPAFGGGTEEKGHLRKCRGPPGECGPCPLHIATGHGLGAPSRWPSQLIRGPRKSRGLLSAETNPEDLLSLLCYEGGIPSEPDAQIPLAHSDVVAGSSGGQKLKAGERAEMSLGPSEEAEREEPCQWDPREGAVQEEKTSLDCGVGPSQKREPSPDSAGIISPENKVDMCSFPVYKEVPGPCELVDLLEGVIFGAKYLGSTQLVSEKNPPTSVRMAQAQEAMDRIKAPEGESQPMTEVDLFVSTQRIKVLTADSQEAMMDHPLKTISYIADIGNIIVLMARRKLPRRADASIDKLYKMICHVFYSADAQLMAQAIDQAFSVAYQQFLRANGIDPSQLNPQQPDDDDDDDEDALAKGEELYNGDLVHFSKQENCKKVTILKQKGEILGVVIVESGWGSILPTVVIANLMHRGAAERSGKLSIGDRIMSVNGTSLVGLPLTSCQNIIRDLKHQTEVTLSVVHCPPVTTALVRRPDTKYPLGFCVENGIICSLMRGGIAERGGIRVGHRIIEINGQSVVAMPHEKIIQILTQAVSEVHIKTMPASTYRLLTGQEQPVFL